jgi:hypothetical protein
MTTPSNKPSHRIYAVTKRKNGDKNDWTEIGAAWAHQDGKGFSLKLDFLPLNGAELSLRVPKPKDATDAASSDQDNAPATEGGY